MTRTLLTAFAASLATCLVLAATSEPHWKPGLHNQRHAIVGAFCHGNNRLAHPCRYGREALKVAQYESGARHWFGGTCRRASNGQYLGCFQMGSRERATYGHGNDPWSQARAAYRYFVASGRDWSPWECKPWGCGW